MSSQACAKVGTTTMSWDDPFHDGDALFKLVWPLEEMSGEYRPFGRSSNLATNNQQIHIIQKMIDYGTVITTIIHVINQQRSSLSSLTTRGSLSPPFHRKIRETSVALVSKPGRVNPYDFTTGNGNQWKSQHRMHRKPKGWILYPPCLEDKSTYLLLEIFIKTIGTCAHCCGLLRNPAPLGRWITGTFHSYQLVQDFATIHSPHDVPA